MAGYSGTPLAQKLGIRPGDHIWVIDAPAGYDALLAPWPPGARVVPERQTSHRVVHVFATSAAALERLFPEAMAAIPPDGMVWVSWPKKASGAPTDLDGNAVRKIGLAAGLVDVKVCAVDATWSGLKFVWREADRPRQH